MAFLSMTKRVVAVGVVLVVCGGMLRSLAANDKDFQIDFSVDKKNLGVNGSNPYFNLVPGYQMSYRHGKETKVVTVLDEIKRIDDVDSRVVEDREFDSDGKIVELTRRYYAIDVLTNDVYCMGKDVDEYDKYGMVTGHGGSWLSGVNGAKFGLMMPAIPRAGARFYQVQAAGVAMDRVEIPSLTDTLAVPAGWYTKVVVHAVETTPLEKGKEHKWYVAGVGAVKDDDMELVKYGMKYQ
jgi:hypothetical protein